MAKIKEPNMKERVIDAVNDVLEEHPEHRDKLVPSDESGMLHFLVALCDKLGVGPLALMVDVKGQTVGVGLRPPARL